MKHQIKYLHCGGNLKESLKDEIDEVLSVVNLIEWKEEFKVIKPDSTLLHQTAYNKRFEAHRHLYGHLNPHSGLVCRKYWLGCGRSDYDELVGVME